MLRRAEKEIKELSDVLSVLENCEVLRLGLCAEGRPYVVPLNFAVKADENGVRIYVHCASEGRKMDMIAQNNRVCFETDRAFEAVPSENACAWSAHFESVIGEGTISVVTSDGEKRAGLDLLMKRYGFAGQPVYNPQALAKVTVLVIHVEQITGKAG